MTIVTLMATVLTSIIVTFGMITFFLREWESRVECFERDILTLTEELNIVAKQVIELAENVKEVRNGNHLSN